MVGFPRPGGPGRVAASDAVAIVDGELDADAVGFRDGGAPGVAVDDTGDGAFVDDGAVAGSAADDWASSDWIREISWSNLSSTEESLIGRVVTGGGKTTGGTIDGIAAVVLR